MKCPTCNIDLLMTECQGVEIDYCPQCRRILGMEDLMKYLVTCLINFPCTKKIMDNQNEKL